ncbi:hypothetical protein ES319_D09G103700v1 [Gossypium barbadense]|uniref:Uncharacterized protein n=1 Tax=Gossypium barbadense TaxID=3634 RepID=A0A5J5Q1C4_GOSBA|nr:hypothetical protein ES319_D09G103700v1 [Gossypium barbadense]
MIFPRKIKTSLSSIAAFFIPRRPELYRQEEPPSLPRPATAAGIDIEETLPALQNHQQWQNAVISFCFSYALGLSLQYAETPLQSNQHLPFPTVLLSFLVLLTFTCILGAFFINPYCTTTSNALQKVGLLLAAAAFTHTLSIPLPFELKCTIWAVFLLPLLTAIILTYFNTKTA